MTHTFKGHDVEVLETSGNLSTISEQGVVFTVRTSQLKEKKDLRSLSTRLLEEELLPALTEEGIPTFNELLPRWDLVESVRVLAPGRVEEKSKGLFDRLGIVYPSGWRGTVRGKRKADAQEQRTLAATVVLKDGRHFNDLGMTLWLLSRGQSFGWKVTKEA
jgi:hypothetical protein